MKRLKLDDFKVHKISQKQQTQTNELIQYVLGSGTTTGTALAKRRPRQN